MLKWMVNPGEEVLSTLQKQCDSAGITEAAIVSLIGAVDSARISNMPADDAENDIITDLHQPFELSGTGEIKSGEVHVHVSLSGEGNAALHGHLHSATVTTWYVAAYVAPMEV
jgi:predicted DNA-binding protein with PD1-like motif